MAVEGGSDTYSAAGFCVRAERGDGIAYEALTDASGVAKVPVDPSAGPWDVTAARYGYEAVSVLGVDGPIAGSLYSEQTGSSGTGSVYDQWRIPPGTTPKQLEIHLPAGQDSLQDWMVFDQNVPLTLYSNETGGYAFTEFFVMHPNAPAFQITAFSPSVGAFSLPPAARTDRDMSLTLDTPSSPPPAKIATDVTVQLPWAVTTNVLNAGGPVLRPCGPGSQRCTAPGVGTLSLLATPSTTMPWHIESFAAPMDADTAVASFDATLLRISPIVITRFAHHDRSEATRISSGVAFPFDETVPLARACARC